MKNLRFHELLLVSQKERSGRRIRFHEKVTVIRGSNDTGKSSIIKSLYRTLGAEPPNIHPRWEAASVVSSLRFSVDDQHYRMLRQGSRLALFGQDDKLIKVFASVTQDLAPYFADLFSFHLFLKSGDSDKQATPAFLFLAFYIDQDQGWQRTLASFDRLGQFQNWKPDTVSFHTGVRPSEYYIAKSKRNVLDKAATELRKERDGFAAVLDSVRARLDAVSFDLDIGAFRLETDQLLEKCSRLQEEENGLRSKLTDIYNKKESAEEQIQIVKGALTELRADREFATNLSVNTVICPTCHATYENGFAERFEIALDEDGCMHLLAELEEQRLTFSRQWDLARQRAQEASRAVSEVELLLTTKREKIALSDIIRKEGQKDVSNALRREIEGINGKIGSLDEGISEASADMAGFEDRKRQKEIKGVYLQEMGRLLRFLSVDNIDERSYSRLDASIKETGSDLPRAILAYYLSVTKTIQKFGTSTFCPMVIDSPRQQDQDEQNWQRMLDCLQKMRPEGQLILALVDDDGRDFGGDVIEFNEKLHVLREHEFESAIEELSPLIDASLKG